MSPTMFIKFLYEVPIFVPSNPIRFIFCDTLSFSSCSVSPPSLSRRTSCLPKDQGYHVLIKMAKLLEF